MPSLVVVGQTVRHIWRLARKICPLLSCISRSLKVIRTNTDLHRCRIYDFLIHNILWCISYCFQGKWRFQTKKKHFSSSPWELCNGCEAVKIIVMPPVRWSNCYGIVCKWTYCPFIEYTQSDGQAEIVK